MFFVFLILLYTKIVNLDWFLIEYIFYYLTQISNIKEIIYEIGGEAMSVGSSMPTVPINGIISEDTD